MSDWFDLALVIVIVFVSAVYAAYALGPRRLKDAYSRLATRYFGLRAAKWFASKGSDCDGCPSHDEHRPWRKPSPKPK